LHAKLRLKQPKMRILRVKGLARPRHFAQTRCAGPGHFDPSHLHLPNRRDLAAVLSAIQQLTPGGKLCVRKMRNWKFPVWCAD
jgi:hypothetical protein